MGKLNIIIKDNKNKLEDIDPKILVSIFLICLFFIGKAFFMFSAGVVCENSGGKLFKHNSSIVCVIESDLNACVDLNGNVKPKSWVDDLNITYDINLSGDDLYG